MMLKGFFVVAFLIQLSHSHPDGAGVESCVNMLPDHGTTPLPNPPYTITPSATSVSQGQTLTVTLARTLTTVFIRGFMIQARNPAGAPVGEFFLTTGMRTMVCPGFPPASVATHSNAVPRENIAIVWTAPSNYAGPVVFTATVVDSFAAFYMNVLSPTVNVTP